MKRAILLSEEDVRTKVVSTWLLDHGFGNEHIHLEYSFSIRLGRQKFQVESGQISRISGSIPKKNLASPPVLRPRSDILVRNSEGKNLLIIEVKGPNEKIDDDARDQGISYARLLDDIPPFVIVTNGHETRIFDSITRECIDGQRIPLNHPCVIAGFSVGLSDVSLRSEALEKLISLSEDNLISFCTAQCLSRMKRLRSNDPNSGKRYIPSLYVERIRAKEDLMTLLERKNNSLILLTGPPQVGKTNFICHLIEELLGKGMPCLFYSAIDVLDGLFEEISQDFEWIMGNSHKSAQAIRAGLESILIRSGKTLRIFIDGLNEATPESAQRIDSAIQHLLCNDIQIIISLADFSISRLFKDQTGNPTWIADAVNITNDETNNLRICHEKRERPVVHLSSFDPREFIDAYDKYSAAYSVTVPECHQMASDPFLIGLAFRLYQNRILPDNLDGPELVSEWIMEKIGRSGYNDNNDVKSFLTKLATEMIRKHCLVSESIAGKIWGLTGIRRLPERLFESSLLNLMPGNPNCVDFSSDNERSFVIAYWARLWPDKTKSFMEIDSEFASAVASSFGTEAARWYLKQPRHIDQIRKLDKFPIFREAKVNDIWLTSLELTDELSHESEFFEYLTLFFFDDPDYNVKAAAGWLIERSLRENDLLLSNFSRKEFAHSFVDVVIKTHTAHSLTENIGIKMTNILSGIARHLSVSDYPSYHLWDYLREILLNEHYESREAAAIVLSSMDPYYFLQVLVGAMREIRNRQIPPVDFLPAVEDACSQILRDLEACSNFADDDIYVDVTQDLSIEYFSIIETLRYVFRDFTDVDSLHQLWKMIPTPTRPWYE
jgi:DNA polymerase III delta prime subunit